MYHLFVTIKVCPKVERTYDVGAPSRINLTLPGTDRVDAQRRKLVGFTGWLLHFFCVCVCVCVCGVYRQRALKALDERLSKTGSQPQMWPSMDEPGSSQDEQDLLPPAASNSAPIPPPDMVVVEKIPAPGGEENTGEGGGQNTANQPPVTTDSAS